MGRVFSQFFRNKKYTLLLFVIFFAAFTISCNEKSAPTEAGGNNGNGSNGGGANIDTAGKIFVLSTGSDSGDGTKVKPYKSISEALIKASSSLIVDTIMIATGSYYENFTISQQVVILGGRVAEREWMESTGYSIVYGIAIRDRTATVEILQVDQPIYIRGLTIACTVPKESSSMIASLLLENVADITLLRCRVLAPETRRGLPGSELPLDTLKMQVGQLGGSGGWGGIGTTVLGEYGQDGYQGICSDGTRTGGLGGTAAESRTGEPGPDGIDGVNGIGGIAGSLFMDFSASPIAIRGEDGQQGQSGRGGCGGGGGAGGTSCMAFDRQLQPIRVFGCEGTRGGKGGRGGFGGQHGKGGESSVAIILHESGVRIDKTEIFGGNAGDGGIGEVGSDGFLGTSPERPFRCSWSWISCNVGTSGGSGGAGGRGGHGGGGAGGWSIGILSINSTIVKDAATTIITGTPGKGGIGPTPESTGADGKAVTILEL